MKRGQKMRTFRSPVVLFGLLAAIAFVRTARAAEADFNGRWDIEVLAKAADIQFTTTKAWWLGITGAGTPEMKIQFVGSPDGSLDDITEAKVEGNVLHFIWTPRVRPGVTPNPNDRLEYEAKYVNGVLQGKMTGSQGEVAFTGRRAPEINEHDDGTWIKGKPITLFNGKDLKGWTGVDSDKAEGWTVENGILKGRGQADDLITVAKYWNFELHVEYRLGEKSNSGIGLRGRYEVQIASDYGRPPNMHGTGALYTRVLPSVNAGKPPDEWQTYDIRLVGREVTTTLNGQKLYERGVIDGLTGIAFDPFEGRPGPIELQGDHGSVEFRNLVLIPLTQRKDK
jgi:Domain of Unknown Function (DUF1080)